MGKIFEVIISINVAFQTLREGSVFTFFLHKIL